MTERVFVVFMGMLWGYGVGGGTRRVGCYAVIRGKLFGVVFSKHAVQGVFLFFGFLLVFL